ncbi:MAG: autotransporter outer membrane beta-barrel domain-containing protein [Alphaproteobacteria bacterium]|jgi:hypothetical protein|nr:autotransporter outer membrane beta-barrel domain-containing protein [Alphaproteobacteria bacterium]
MKKLFILSLLCFTIVLMLPKESYADFNNGGTNCTTATGGGSYSGEIVCGPWISSPSNPNNDGSSQALWAGQTKNLSSLTIFRASLYLTKNTRLNFTQNSVLNFDGGGCQSGTDGVGGNCGNSGDGTTGNLWGVNILDMDSSEIFQGGGNDAVFNIRDVNRIQMANGSNATFGTIKDNGNYTKIDFIVDSSDLSIKGIELSQNNGSNISNFLINNTEKERGHYLININNGIKATSIYNFKITNGDVIIGGDIVADGGIAPLALLNSDLVLNGNKLSMVTTFDLRNGAVLKVDPWVGKHTITMGGGSADIMLEGGSTMTAQDIMLVVPTLNIKATDEDTLLSMDTLYFDKSQVNDFSMLNIDLSLKAKANIGTIDTNTACLNGCGNGDKQINLNGDALSSYEIGKIIVADDLVSLNTAASSVDIKNIDYQNDHIKIYAKSLNESNNLHIGNINVLNDAVLTTTDTATGNKYTNYLVDIKYQNATIDNMTFKSADILSMTIDSSTLKLGDITCVSCKTTTFVGKGNDISVAMKNYNSGSGGQQNIFQGIKLDVSGTYASNGTFDVSGSTLNFNSLVGNYDSINLSASTLNINGESKIILSSGSIDIDKSSTLNIKSANVFSKPVNQIDNKGNLNISAANDINTLNNDGIAYLNGSSHINLINNNSSGFTVDTYECDGNICENRIYKDGILKLDSGATIDTLNDTGGQIVVSGGNYIKNFDATSDTSLLFVVDTKTSKPGLTIGNMNPYTGDIAISFTKLSVLKPGLKNRYDILTTENGSIGIKPNDPDNPATDDFFHSLRVLAPWLKYEADIERNGNGETAWVNVQRLTDYETIIGIVPGYSRDKSVMNIAKLIDTVVFDTKVTDGLEDVVNSLDLNSACGGLSQQERDDFEKLIYLVHNDKGSPYDIKPTSCLNTMAEHMNNLKPVSNEVYALYAHNNTQKSLDTLLEANREYVYSNEIYSWYKADVGYTSLADKNYDTGFNSINSMFFAGATVSPFNNSLNFSGLLGFGIGNLNGNSNMFNGTSNTLAGGLAASYLNNSYYVSLASSVGWTNFHTNRNIAFLDNTYVDNHNPIATSSLSVLEVATKVEAGKEFIISSTTFMTPKVFAAQSVLNNSGYKEFGSSGSVQVSSANLLMSEVGVGAELRRELIMPAWTGIKNAFWYPKIGVNVVERFYNDPITKMQFVGVIDDAYANIIGANYSGVLTQAYASVLYQAKSFALQAGYNGEVSMSGYMNHSLNAILKYSFR